jgi:predicted  nucleic acid-binding Zn-ribbon protein
MSQEVVQWLNEIKDLKQQVSQLQAALAESEASADRWRQLYDTEAQQRRQDAKIAQDSHVDLQGQIATFNQGYAPSDLERQRDKLTNDLRHEKVSHEQTRKNLTTALADAMELISKGSSRLSDVAE